MTKVTDTISRFWYTALTIKMFRIQRFSQQTLKPKLGTYKLFFRRLLNARNKHNPTMFKLRTTGNGHPAGQFALRRAANLDLFAMSAGTHPSTTATGWKINRRGES